MVKQDLSPGCKDVSIYTLDKCDVYARVPSHVRLFLTPWIVTHQATLSIVFSQTRILEWVTISSSRGIIPTRGSNLCLLHWQVDSLPLCHLGSPKKCDIFFSQNERKKYDHFHDTKKAFDKIQHPFMVKTLNKFGTEGTSLKKIKLYRTSPELILHM